MFIDSQSAPSRQYYERMLKLLASLSGLFSDNTTPYLHYRVAENLFCRAFSAVNRSRADASVDATKNSIGIGIKTFIEKSSESSFEKIAEFNAEHGSFRSLSDREKIQLISKYRNDRIETTRRAYSIDNVIYHCVTRTQDALKIFETDMSLIDIDSISGFKASGNQLYFKDTKKEYKFDVSKSTLYSRFFTPKKPFLIPVQILEHPFDKLEAVFQVRKEGLADVEPHVSPYVVLPLYAIKGGKKVVPESSGLNQWNARGRRRHPNEVYIPVPLWMHKAMPDFFPGREEPFTLLLPDGKILSAKVCQQGGKAIMSNPNSALGEWVLRKVLNMKEGELLNYDRLLGLNIDSVKIARAGNAYTIDFIEAGAFEEFTRQHKPSTSN